MLTCYLFWFIRCLAISQNFICWISMTEAINYAICNDIYYQLIYRTCTNPYNLILTFIRQNLKSLHVKIIWNMLFLMYWRNCKGEYCLQILALFFWKICFFYFIIMCVHICFCVMPVCRYLKKQQQGVSSSGAGITGCFELPKVGTGDQSGAFTLIHRDITPAL